jgi:microcystin-dependent protein
VSNPFIAEIRMFAGNFAPRNWATCDAQLLPIAQNTALFSLLGTQYGGNGQTNFQLPDLRNRSPISQGTGPGLTPRNVGDSGGVENVTLILSQIPAHAHGGLQASDDLDDVQLQANPTTYYTQTASVKPVYNANTPTIPMSANTMTQTGGGQPHNNRQPYLGILFIIALQGVFPARN